MQIPWRERGAAASSVAAPAVSVDQERGPVRCSDCGVEEGALHLVGCEVEVCPVCGGQALACYEHCRTQAGRPRQAYLTRAARAVRRHEGPLRPLPAPLAGDVHGQQRGVAGQRAAGPVARDPVS